MADVTIYVSNQAELYKALEDSTGGETILLAPGDYGAVTISNNSGANINPTSLITIKSLDSENYASFSELHLSGVSNFTFSNLNFNYSFSSSDPIYYRPFEVNYSSSIQITDSIFSGDVATGVSEAADGYGYAIGLGVSESENVIISNNEFESWFRGAVFEQSDNLIVSNNEVHSIRMDGMDFTQISNVLIENNYFHDFATSPTSTDHCDFIQFWTSGTYTPSTNITIRENILDMRDGGSVESIFMRNEQVDMGLAGHDMYYQNVVIEQNLILGGHKHGITVGETRGLLIQGNTVLSAPNPESSVNIPLINVASESTDVSILKNAVANIDGYVNQMDWLVSGNAFIQNTDPNGVGYYSDVFVESSMFGPNGVADYVAAPGSMLENLQAGYSGLFSFSSSQTVRALFDVATSSDDPDIYILDGRYSFGSSGAPLPDGTLYTWQSDAGETYEGSVLSIKFPEPGSYALQLKVSTPDGSVSVAFAQVYVPGYDLLTFDNRTGAFLLSGYGKTEQISEIAQASVALPSGNFAIDLGALGTELFISRHSIERVFGAESLSLSFSVQADTVGASGEVFRLHQSFISSITSTGELLFRIYSETGESIVLATTGAGLNDGQVHDIEIVLDNVANTFSIDVDGSVSVETVSIGALPSMGAWDLVFGNPWGEQNFDGKIFTFDLDVSNREYPVILDSGTSDLFADAVLSSKTVTDTANSSELQFDQIDLLEGYSLDFFALESKALGKLIGNAYVETSSLQPFLVLDGKNDSAQLGILDEVAGSSKLTVDVDFSLGGDGARPQNLFSSSSQFRVDVSADSLQLTMNNGARSSSLASYIVTDLALAGSGKHNLRVVVDTEIDRVQLVLDGKVVLDGRDHDLHFESNLENFWTGGWSIGEGGRRGDDFEGTISGFGVDDTSLFVGM